MKKLHATWGDRVHFVDVLIRQAHPGADEGPYERFEDKFRDAELFQHCEGLSWEVLVDDLEGTTHQVYGALSDPTYLIGTDGRIAYYDMWTHAPTLYLAIEALLRQDGRGIVRGGWNRAPHLLSAITDGWRGLRRGWPQSVIDMMEAVPGSPLPVWVGAGLKPVLAPFTLREKPLTTGERVALGVAGMLLAVGAWGLVSLRRAHRSR